MYCGYESFQEALSDPSLCPEFLLCLLTSGGDRLNCTIFYSGCLTGIGTHFLSPYSNTVLKYFLLMNFVFPFRHHGHKCKKQKQNRPWALESRPGPVLTVLFPDRVTLVKLPKFSFLTYKVKIIITQWEN